MKPCADPAEGISVRIGLFRTWFWIGRSAFLSLGDLRQVLIRIGVDFFLAALATDKNRLALDGELHRRAHAAELFVADRTEFLGVCKCLVLGREGRTVRMIVAVFNNLR